MISVKTFVKLGVQNPSHDAGLLSRFSELLFIHEYSFRFQFGTSTNGLIEDLEDLSGF